MANISEGNLSLLQEIVPVAGEDTTGRDDEENETITPAKDTNSDIQMVGNLTTMDMGRKGITRGVVVKLDDGHELEMCIMKVGEKKGLEEDCKEVTKMTSLEDTHDISNSVCTSDSVPGSSDSLFSTKIAEEEVTANGEYEDSATDEAVTDLSDKLGPTISEPDWCCTVIGP